MNVIDVGPLQLAYCLVFILIKSFYGTFVKWRQHVAVQEMRRKAGPAEKEN